MHELQEVEQKKDEKISEFAQRIKKLKSQLESSYGDQSIAISRKQNDKLAKECFIRGLNDKTIKTLTFGASHKTLEDAIAFALEKRTFRQDLAPIPRSESQNCNFCQGRGHTEDDCRHKQRAMDFYRNRGTNNNRQFNNDYGNRNNQSFNRNQYPARPNICCYNCNRQGHYSSQCRFPPKKPHSILNLLKIKNSSKLKLLKSN